VETRQRRTQGKFDTKKKARTSLSVIPHHPPATPRLPHCPRLPPTVVDALRRVECRFYPALTSRDARPSHPPGPPQAVGDWSSPDVVSPVAGELPPSDGSSSAGGFSGGLAHSAAAEFALPPPLALAGAWTAAVAPTAAKGAAAVAATSDEDAAAVSVAAVFDFFVGFGGRAREPAAAPGG